MEAGFHLCIPQLCRANPSAAVTGTPSARLTPPPRLRIVPSVSKPRKVEEPQAPYAAKKPAKAGAQAPAGPRFADLEKVRANNAKLIRVHSKVLQKLAQ